MNVYSRNSINSSRISNFVKNGYSKLTSNRPLNCTDLVNQKTCGKFYNLNSGLDYNAVAKTSQKSTNKYNSIAKIENKTTDILASVERYVAEHPEEQFQRVLPSSKLSQTLLYEGRFHDIDRQGNLLKKVLIPVMA